MTAVILLVVFFGLLIFRTPIAFAIGIASLLALMTGMPWDVAAATLAQRTITGFDSFTLLAIPFFILAGYLMSTGGIARRLIDAAKFLVGGIPGGLAFTNILSSMIFGSVSGSAIASTSAIGSFMGPEMEKAGYPRSMSAAITTTASTTGLLIPPSNVLIVYAVASGGVSVAALFAAGYLPGILLGLALMLVCVGLSIGRNIPTPNPVSWRQGLRALADAILPLSMIVVIVGGILAGIFTATESGAIAVLYTLILSTVVYRQLTLSEFVGILIKSVETTGIVLLLIGFSTALAWVMAYANLPQMATDALLGISDNPIILLIVINLLLLLVGAFLDITPGILIFTPILLPIGIELGISPVQFGIIMVLNFSIGLCTPPVGSVLFVGSAIFQTPVEKMIKPLLPLFAAMIIVLFLVTFVPAISLWIPELLGLIK